VRFASNKPTTIALALCATDHLFQCGNAMQAPFAVSIALLGSAAPSATEGCGSDIYCIALNFTQQQSQNVVTVVGGGGKTR
jgi:hypothetical protein